MWLSDWLSDALYLTVSAANWCTLSLSNMLLKMIRTLWTVHRIVSSTNPISTGMTFRPCNHIAMNSDNGHESRDKLDVDNKTGQIGITVTDQTDPMQVIFRGLVLLHPFCFSVTFFCNFLPENEPIRYWFLRNFKQTWICHETWWVNGICAFRRLCLMI